MDKIDKLKIFLQENYPNEQAFNTRNLIGDNMRTVYDEDGIIVDYCYEYEYIEIFGLTDVEFENLIDDYGMLKNFNDEMMEENSIKNERSSIEEAIKIMEHWIEYEKNNKEKINRADELINIQETILSDYKKALKENEELKQDRNNNYQIIALAQNEALGYMQGYEDGKKLKRSAVANIVENQQYYIFNKQIEHYKEYIEKLLKENELLRTEVNSLKEDNERYQKLELQILESEE
jgi:hypothetical protein